jgi:hypothetical protein
MDRIRDSDARRSAIYNAGYVVRHYRRGGRMSPHSPTHAQRRAAIIAFGRAVRDAFNEAADDEIEPLIVAVIDAVLPRDDWPRF